MKISKLIELLQPYQEREVLVEYTDPGTGDRETVEVSGVRLEFDCGGAVCKAVILT